jgi:hypothetical protein
MKMHKLDIVTIQELYNQLGSCRKIAHKLNTSKTTIERFCHENGIVIKKPGRPEQPCSWKAEPKNKELTEKLETWLLTNKGHLPKTTIDIAKASQVDLSFVRHYLRRRLRGLKDQIKSLPTLNFLDDNLIDQIGCAIIPAYIHDYEWSINPITTLVTLKVNTGFKGVRKVVISAKELIFRLRKTLD